MHLAFGGAFYERICGYSECISVSNIQGAPLNYSAIRYIKFTYGALTSSLMHIFHLKLYNWNKSISIILNINRPVREVNHVMERGPKFRAHATKRDSITRDMCDSEGAAPLFVFPHSWSTSLRQRGERTEKRFNLPVAGGGVTAKKRRCGLINSFMTPVRVHTVSLILWDSRVGGHYGASTFYDKTPLRIKYSNLLEIKLTNSEEEDAAQTHTIRELTIIDYPEKRKKLKAHQGCIPCGPNSGRFNQYVCWKMDEPEFL
ncbi:hypothetical protein EAG_12387 [Camponotus floridanus]|uniref:Uncharacterized protein n=1 Tax=Camponotus floridanus TaxID=104421 RepID=E2AWC4_CAMFO|nr:hypothetical protein EAG_12387 [Camponotus floridanus]